MDMDQHSGRAFAPVDVAEPPRTIRRAMIGRLAVGSAPVRMPGRLGDHARPKCGRGTQSAMCHHIFRGQRTRDHNNVSAVGRWRSVAM